MVGGQHKVIGPQLLAYEPWFCYMDPESLSRSTAVHISKATTRNVISYLLLVVLRWFKVAILGRWHLDDSKISFALDFRMALATPAMDGFGKTLAYDGSIRRFPGPRE